MTLAHHRRITGSILLLLAMLQLWGMFGYSFAVASPLEKLIYVAAMALSLVAGVALIRDRAWGYLPGLPVLLALIAAFPLGTAASAYALWVMVKLDLAVIMGENAVIRRLQHLSLLDFQVLAFLSVLLPYGTLAGNTIGGLNFLATALATLLSLIGLGFGLVRKSPLAWLYGASLLFSVGLFLIREFAAGYGP